MKNFLCALALAFLAPAAHATTPADFAACLGALLEAPTPARSSAPVETYAQNRGRRSFLLPLALKPAVREWLRMSPLPPSDVATVLETLEALFASARNPGSYPLLTPKAEVRSAVDAILSSISRPREVWGREEVHLDELVVLTHQEIAFQEATVKRLKDFRAPVLALTSPYYRIDSSLYMNSADLILFSTSGEISRQIHADRVHLFGGHCQACLTISARDLIGMFLASTTKPKMEVFVHTGLTYNTWDHEPTIQNGSLAQSLTLMSSVPFRQILNPNGLARAFGALNASQLSISDGAYLDSPYGPSIRYTVTRPGLNRTVEFNAVP